MIYEIRGLRKSSGGDELIANYQEGAFLDENEKGMMHFCFVLSLEIFSLIPSGVANESHMPESGCKSMMPESGLQINEHTTVQPCLPERITRERDLR